MMRIALTLCLLLFTSCGHVTYTTPSYKEYVKTFTFWPDFTNGKLMLYDLEAPGEVKMELHHQVTKDFKKLLGDRFSEAYETDDLIELGINNFSKEILRDLKKQTGVDYLMIIKATDNPSEYYRHISLNADPFKDGYYNETISSNDVTFLNLAILDLNQEKLIYHRAIRAVIYTQELKLINFQTPHKKMILKSYKKLFKGLKKRAK